MIKLSMAAVLTVLAVSARAGEDAGLVLAAPLAAMRGAALASKAKLDQAIVRDQTTEVPVDLNDKTVKCSAADYSGPMLKVLVPGLADLTVLNHRNTREGAPCIAAGRCGAIGPKDVLKTGAGVDAVKIRVVLRKETSVEGEVCHVSLVETVSTVIRGIPFHHERVQEVAERSAADCR